MTASIAVRSLSAKWFYRTIAVGSLGTVMTGPITALYAREFGASDGVAALVVSSMTLSFLCLDLVGSRLVPRVDARAALVGGYLVFGIGSFASAIAPNLETMVAARVLQGFGAAFPMGAGFQMALRLAAPGREGQEIARFNSCSFLGMTFGPLLVGAIAEALGGIDGMRWGFAACGVVNVLSALIARLALPSIPSATRPGLGLPSRVSFGGGRSRTALVGAGLGFGLRGVAGMTLLPLLGNEIGAGASQVVLATTCLSVAELGGIMCSGRLSDQLGRLPVIIASAASSAVVLLVALVSLSIPAYFVLSAALGFVLSALRVVPAAMVVDVADSEEAAAVGWRIACDVNSLATALVLSWVLAFSGLRGGFVYAAMAATIIGGLGLVVGETRPPQQVGSAASQGRASSTRPAPTAGP